jgi:hypothetical protein
MQTADIRACARVSAYSDLRCPMRDHPLIGRAARLKPCSLHDQSFHLDRYLAGDNI